MPDCCCPSNFGHTCEEVQRLKAEVARLRDIAEWAMDADHHPGCLAAHNHPQGVTTDPPAKPYPCKCGRDALVWEGVR